MNRILFLTLFAFWYSCSASFLTKKPTTINKILSINKQEINSNLVFKAFSVVSPLNIISDISLVPAVGSAQVMEQMVSAAQPPPIGTSLEVCTPVLDSIEFLAPSIAPAQFSSYGLSIYPSTADYGVLLVSRVVLNSCNSAASARCNCMKLCVRLLLWALLDLYLRANASGDGFLPNFLRDSLLTFLCLSNKLRLLLAIIYAAPLRYKKLYLLIFSPYYPCGNIRENFSVTVSPLHLAYLVVCDLFTRFIVPDRIIESYANDVLSVKFGPAYSSDNAGDGPPGGIIANSQYPVYAPHDFENWTQNFEIIVRGEPIRQLFANPPLAYDDVLPDFDPDPDVPSNAKYLAKNKKLFQILVTCIIRCADTSQQAIHNDFISRGTVRIDDGMALWNALISHHTVASVGRQYKAVKDFISCKMAANETADAFRTRLNKCYRDFLLSNLSSIQLAAMIYINGVNEIHMPFVSSLLSTDDPIDLDWVHNRFTTYLTLARRQVDTAQANAAVGDPESVEALVARRVREEFRRRNDRKRSNENRTSQQPNQRPRTNSSSSSAAPVRPSAPQPTAAEKDASRRLSIVELNRQYPRGPAPHERDFTCRRCGKKGHADRTCRVTNIAHFVTEVSLHTDYSSADPASIKLVVDSGCSRHMLSTPDITQMTNVRPASATVNTFSGIKRALKNAYQN